MQPTEVDSRAALRGGIDALFVDVGEAIRRGLLEPQEFSDVDRVLAQLDSMRRREGTFAAARLASTAEVVRDMISRSGRATSTGPSLGSEFARLSSALGFRRSLLSSIDDDRWRPEYLHLENGLAARHVELRTYLDHRTIDLRDAPLERSAIEARSAHLVSSPKTHELTFKPLMAISDSHGYVVAPLFSGGALIGMIHADRFDEPATDSDLARVAFSTRSMGLIAERITQRRDLSELADRLTNVVRYAEEVLCGRARIDGAVSRPMSRDATANLTARQYTIMENIAAGATNAQIARDLGLAEGTVKTHVKKIYAKLGVCSRAAATAAFRSGFSMRAG